MKFLYLYFFSLFFIFNVNASTNFEKISNDFEFIYNEWNNGNFDKYEDIFRRDHENAFSTCSAVTCGASLLEHYNRVLNNLQNATGEKSGMFGKKFTYDEYQNYKNIYFEQKSSSAYAIKNMSKFLKKYNASILKIKNLCGNEDMADIESDKLENMKINKQQLCNNLILQSEENLKVLQLELSNFRTLLNYSLNENHNNSLKKSSELLISYNDKILSLLDQGFVKIEKDTQSINLLTENLQREKLLRKRSSLFGIKFLSFKKDFLSMIIDKDKLDPTVEFFYQKFDKLKVSIFRYEFNPEAENDIFERYYFDTLKIMNKNDNPEPIVRVVAFSKQIYDDRDICIVAAQKVVNQLIEQKELPSFVNSVADATTFRLLDSNNNEYMFSYASYCNSSLFSNKYSFSVQVGIENNLLGKVMESFIDDLAINREHYNILKLMGYKFKNNENKLKNNKIKF